GQVGGVVPASPDLLQCLECGSAAGCESCAALLGRHLCPVPLHGFSLLRAALLCKSGFGCHALLDMREVGRAHIAPMLGVLRAVVPGSAAPLDVLGCAGRRAGC